MSWIWKPRRKKKKNYSKLTKSNGIVSIHYHLKIRHKKSMNLKKKKRENCNDGVLDVKAGSSALYVRVYAHMRVFSQSCSAQNCWYTARMWWSSSAVNSRFSSVPMYCWMVTWCCRGKERGTVTREVTHLQYKCVCVCVSYHEKDLL